ncbi:MAG: outer membrane protein assembly factor BamB family protein [Acidimicrobiales bacterium]
MIARLTAVATVVLLLGPPAFGDAQAAPPCTQSPVAGGDWPMSGHDLSNSRRQPHERTLTPTRVASLRPVWSFSTGHPSGPAAGNLSDFNATPIEAGGCVYVGSGAADAPNVFALDADTGRLVWKTHLDAGLGGLGGAVVGSLVRRGDVVFALVNQPGDGRSGGPYVAALDARTGSLRWRSRPIVVTAGSYTNATPTVADGVVIAGFSAPEGDPYGHGGFGLVDATSGQVLVVTYTVPSTQWGTPTSPKYAGGGIWTTPAADVDSGYAYFGSGNPFSKRTQYPTTDAILKVDIDRRRRTFGQIIASYSGNLDQSTELLKVLSRPTCTVLPDDPLRTLPAMDKRLQEAQGLLSNSIGCVQLDLDFGAAPNLLHDGRGRLIVGDLQKSGVYHAVDARTMRRVWSSTLGVSCNVCNAASTAYDASRTTVFGDGSPGSLLSAISSADGTLRWSSPVLDGFHYESVSTAAGVVYTVDGLGFFDAFRAGDGVPLLRRSAVLDAGADALPPAGYTSTGVSIARGKVYIEAGSHVVAYRPAPTQQRAAPLSPVRAGPSFVLRSGTP